MLDTLASTSCFCRALRGETQSVPPVWLMRQAGRYLPEYRRLREEAGSFLTLCQTPELAAEITLQPIRRFGFDAAIIFSDILIVPYALGQGLEFVEGEGPKLEPVAGKDALVRLERANAAGATASRFEPVYQALARVRGELAGDTALIGFCGAPWTVATYMVAGHGSKDQVEARRFAYADPARFQALIDLLVDVSADYLLGQVESGANILQIFDSWSGSLPEDEFARWCVAPTKALVAKVKAEAPAIPIIGFPRGAGLLSIDYVCETGIDAFGCDTVLPLGFIKERLQSLKPVQGNLDPVLLLTGGDALDAGIDRILDTLADAPFVFNLGHGILPDTPPEHVARLVGRVRNR